MSMKKIPMTPAGIEPATFRFVAQHLNHCATAAQYLKKSTSTEAQCPLHPSMIPNLQALLTHIKRDDLL